MVEDAILSAGAGTRAGSPQDDARRELRRTLRRRRRDATPAERMAAAEAIAGRLLGHPRFPASGYVAGYWAMQGEVPLHLLQMRLGEGRVWCLPCVQPDGSLLFAPWRPGDPLVTNRFGIPEPDLAPESLLPASRMDVVVLPLVGFSRDGQRLGTGGGFYDRTLAFRQHAPASPPWLVGAGYSFQQHEPLPAREWDVRLDAIVTERELLET
jgi:5-formyltetrahydrofolate cyclo-ligase